MSLSETDETITYKMILIGDSSVGKTCLFKKLTTGVYSDKNISTIGIDRKSISLKLKVNENGVEQEKTFVIQIWDTAGQERFRSITKGYFQDSQGLLLMYDITNKETFDNSEKWITSVKDSLGDDDKEKDKYIIILLGNKLDLAVGDDRRVTTEEAMKKCEEYDLIWGGECSAKDFSDEELKEIFTKYTQEIYKKVGVNIVRGEMVTKTEDNKKKKSFC